MKTVLIAGYYGLQNTGDDALLAVTAWGLRSFLEPDAMVATAPVIPCIAGARLLRPCYVPSGRFPGENALRAYWSAFRSESVVFGGGSILHSKSYLERATNFLRLSGRGPHAALGVAVGPFASSADERACAELLKRLDFVGLRDRRSFEIVRSLAPDVRSEKTFDLAPLLPRASGRTIDSFARPEGSRGIGFALCDFERFAGGDVAREAARRERFRRLFESLPTEPGEEIVFVDFNGHPRVGDGSLHDEVAVHAAKRFRVRRVSYSDDPVGVLEEIGRLRLLVAMRLHAAVFGFMTRTPTILLSYHPKCLAFSDEIGMDAEAVCDSATFDPERVVALIGAGLADRLAAPRLAPADAERRALENWSWCGARHPAPASGAP